MPATWPDDVSTNRASPPSSPTVAYADRHGAMWSSTGRQHVGVGRHRGQVQPGAGQRHLAPGQLVLDVATAQVERVHVGRHAGAVGVPRQDVERRRRLPHQPSALHVVPDEVAGPQQVEHGRHLRRLQVAPGQHLLAQLLDRRPVEELPHRPRLGEVHQRVEQRRRPHAHARPARPTAGGLVGQQHRGQRPAQAQADDVDRVGAGDVGDHVEGLVGAAQEVVVEGDVGHRPRHRCRRVAVADGEDGVALGHRVLGEAPARRQVHDVVLVDPRRAQQQRHLVHRLRGRRRTGSAP